MKDSDIDAACIEINGRYPDKGRTLNEISKEIVFVIDGTGELFVEGIKYPLTKSDVVLIDKGEKYYFNGKMTLFVPCTPPWNPQQHKMVS